MIPYAKNRERDRQTDAILTQGPGFTSLSTPALVPHHTHDSHVVSPLRVSRTGTTRGLFLPPCAQGTRSDDLSECPQL